MPLTVDVLNGKRLDLLGRVQFVSLDASAFGTASLVFDTSNTDFRGDPIFVAYVSVVTSDGNPFPSGYQVVLGSGGSTDFLGGAAVDLSGQASGVIVYNGQTSGGAFPLVTYSPQVPFYAVNASSASSAATGEFSAWGFASN